MSAASETLMVLQSTDSQALQKSTQMFLRENDSFVSKCLSQIASKLTAVPRDGTLLTHRFHFAPIPHRYRHVYGWYKLITELSDCGVRAICVFDGAGRSEAKSGEVLGSYISIQHWL